MDIYINAAVVIRECETVIQLHLYNLYKRLSCHPIQVYNIREEVAFRNLPDRTVGTSYVQPTHQDHNTSSGSTDSMIADRLLLLEEYGILQFVVEL